MIGQIFLWAFLIGMLIFSLVAIYVYTSAFLAFLITEVPFVRSPAADLVPVLKKYGITEKDYLIDLGSGDGRILFHAEKEIGLQVAGWELGGWTYWLSRYKTWRLKSRAQFYCRDFFKDDLSRASVVYAFLYPKFMQGLWEKLTRECRPGTLVITRGFYMPNATIIEEIGNNDLDHLFIYRIEH